MRSTPDLKADAVALNLAVARSAGVGVAVLAALVLASWWAGPASAMRVFADGATMKPNTAFALMFTGFVLWRASAVSVETRRQWPWPVLGAAWLVAVVGFATLVEHLWQVDLRIDDLFVRHQPAVRVGETRMSALVAVDLVFIGLSVLLIVHSRSARGIWPAQLSALAAAFASAIVVTGYVYGADALQLAPFFADTALHTALALLAASIGLMCARPDAGFMALCNAESAGGTLLRRLLPAMIAIPLVIDWLEMTGEHAGHYPLRVGWMIDVPTTGVILCTVAWLVARVVHEKDLTQMKAEAELRQSEERYRLLVEMSPMAIIVNDERGIHFANPAARELVGGAQPEDLIGKSLLAFAHPQTRGKFASDLCSVLRDGTPLPLTEHKVLRRDGEEIHVELCATPVNYRGQRLAQVVARDITDRKRAERALRESDERFRLITETINEVFWIADRDITRVLYVSPAYERVWGRSCQSLYETLSSFLDAVHPDDRERVLGQLEIQQRGLPFSHEYRVVHSDGSVRWVWDRGFPVRDPDGQVSRYVGVAQDITVRKHAEIESRAILERFELLAHATGDTIWEWNPVTNQAWWSQTYYEKYGFPQNTVPTVEAWLSHVHPDDRERAQRELSEAVARKTAFWSSEYRYRRADGTYAIVFDRARTISDSSGRIVRMIGSMVEISQLRRLESDVKLLAHAVESTNEMIAITDLNDRFVFVNRAFLIGYGYRMEEVIGQTPALIASAEVKSERLHAEIRRMAEKDGWSGELINRRKDGMDFPIRLNASAVRDAQGKRIALIGVATDISEHRAMEVQLRQSQKMEAIGQLASGVAHDFNNVLTAIGGHTTMLALSQKWSPATQESFDEILRATQRAANLTRQLLLFGRREAMQPRRLDLNEIITPFARMLQRLLGEDISLALQLHPQPLRIYADVGMIEQVLMNLAINARDAMPNGGELVIETSERLLDSAAAELAGVEGGRFACVRVSDTGCGIAPETLPRIFEPFFTTKEAGKGTGLGLATVFGIAKQHRGGVKVYSEPEQGATFLVLLPITDLPLETVPFAEEKEPAHGRRDDVLFVEDDAAVRDITARMLERQGYQVTTASNGNEALRYWSEFGGHFDLLLTDMVMPGGMSGEELAGKLRAEKPGLKIIFASGYGAVIAGRMLHLQPGQIFLQKPFDVLKLLAAISELLHPEI